MWLVIPLLLGLHVLVCLLLVGSVLMQMPRSEGLGAAFGGGVTENLFGAQTTHVLAKVTVWLGMGFFALTLLLAMAFSHNQPNASKLEKELLASPQVPAAAAAASATPQASPALSLDTEAASPAPAVSLDNKSTTLTLEPPAAAPTPLLQATPEPAAVAP